MQFFERAGSGTFFKGKKAHLRSLLLMDRRLPLGNIKEMSLHCGVNIVV